MDIAVLGAGITGALTALELADAGHDVSLFDRLDVPFGGASLACEGKVHFGYVYALDQTLRTARTMLRGAAAFQPLIERWTGPEVFAHGLSAPFLYAVPNDSLLPVDGIRKHFQAVSGAIADRSGPVTLPESDARCRELSVGAYSQIFDPREVKAVFQTEERAIDTHVLALAMRDALHRSSRITQRLNSEITSVRAADPGYIVAGTCKEAEFSDRFDIVVNCLWEHRIHIDRTLGLRVDRDVIHRFKYGLFTRDPVMLDALSNVTFVIGAFGDTVRFADNAYISWYPDGLISQEVAVRPKVQDPELSQGDMMRMMESSMQNLRRLMPGCAAAFVPDPAIWTLKGGFVTAWGRSGIEERESELHERYDVGVFSHGDYHSIDTGKLTLGPLFAAEVCSRILHRHGAS